MFPVYHYSPAEKGHFHNYLTGILRHRALRMMAEEEKRAARQRKCAEDVSSGGTQFIASATGGSIAGGTRSCASAEDATWRESLLEIALGQLLSDPSIHERTRLVFARVAVNGEKPDEVAASFGMERNAVDQIKSRMMARLKELVAALEKADGA